MPSGQEMDGPILQLPGTAQGSLFSSGVIVMDEDIRKQHTQTPCVECFDVNVVL